MSSNMRSAAYSSLSQGSSRGSHPSSLFPAIIAQLLNATQAYPDAPFAIEGGAEVGQVMLIAQIISMKYHATNNVFCLDDASGRIEARHWIDSPDLVARESYEGVVEGNWARIIGRVRIFNLKLFVNVAHIRAIKDPHEIFYHLTEVMVALTKLTRNTIRASHKQYRDARPRVLHADQTSLPPAQRTVSERYVHLPPLLHSIIMFLHSQPKHDDGYHIAAICEAVGTDVSSCDLTVSSLTRRSEGTLMVTGAKSTRLT
ncbi:nucleic acid-binding protein [Auriscalpium vulgare]|uniref:Nucleic acid-binding protein n=1 Tax=Auriscalpium vulgare TaxID=40419 RepID=A0ACB8R7U0_9AGAM|nr:nucleic acid-binding protein [Auriscalpium vulgare]